jgi:hypothetical protein
MATKTVAYRGHLIRISHPLDPSKIVRWGEEVKVPKEMVLSPLWEEVSEAKKASAKEGEDQ